MAVSLITDVSFTTAFSLSTTPKKFILTDTTDYTTPEIPTTGVNGVFEITDPSGSILYQNTNYSVPDIDRNVSAVNAIEIALPLESDGSVVLGSYSIVYSVKIDDGVNPIYYISQTNTYDNSYVSPEVSITQTINCVTPSFVSVDSTDYDVDGITPTITRTHTINYPYGSANAGSPVVGSTISITTSTFYNGTQTTEISSILSYVFADGLIVTETVTGVLEVLVDCTYICAIYCCLRSLRNNKENNRGYNQKEFDRYSRLFEEVMAEVQFVLVAIDCGKGDDVTAGMARIRTIANCTDDCSCDDGTPVLVTGLGGSGVEVVVSSGGSPITVTSATVGDTTTWTITLSSAFVNKVNASYNTVVVAGSGISVSSATVGDVKTYTITNTSSAAQNRSEFLMSFSYTNIVDPVLSLATTNFLNSGSNMQNATVESVGYGTDPAWNLKNNLFKIDDFQVTPNTTYKVTIGGCWLGDQTIAPYNVYKYATERDAEILNKGNGEFYLRIKGKSPLTNSALRGTTFIISIKISD